MFTPSLALPILSCLRPSAAVVVFDNGGLKTTRTGTEMNDALSAPRTVFKLEFGCELDKDEEEMKRENSHS